MSIDLRTESILSLAQAARMLPPGRRGRPRWVLNGVKTSSGRVRYEAIRMGGRWLTSVKAMERFAARQTPDVFGRRSALVKFPFSPAARLPAVPLGGDLRVGAS
jgi:hypothetical protein